MVSMTKMWVFDVNARLEHVFGGPKGLKKALDETKPGLLSRFFGTRSVAAANLEAAWKVFNNPTRLPWKPPDRPRRRDEIPPTPLP